MIGSDIQFKLEKIDSEYKKVTEESAKAKTKFLDKIKVQMMNSKKKK